MARPREFDEEQALTRAMEVFWAKGYEDTSLDDLLAAMDIRRGSFYNAFENKRDVYLKALSRYFAHITEVGPFGELGEGPHGAEDLQRLMLSFIESVTGPNGPSGCFFAHACSEARGADAEVREIVLSGMRQVRAKLVEMITAAQAAGDIDPGADPDQLATLMIGVVYGFQVLASAGLGYDDLSKCAGQFSSLISG